MNYKKRKRRAVISSLNNLNNKMAADALVFLVRFNAFALPLYIILLTGLQFDPLMQVTTHLAFALLRLTGIDAALHENIISVPVADGSFGAYVSWDSTGWKSMLAMLALIFATEFPLRKKLLGLTLIPAVFAINILRIWFMFFIVTINVAYFEIAHITIWSWGLIFSILILWVIWMKKF